MPILAITARDGTARGVDEHPRANDERKKCRREYPGCGGVTTATG